jgi:regulator of sigma E protease
MEYIFYFILTLGVLVLVHELGHFLAAKLFGMRVERFSIGFPPRAFGKQIGETDYCISWIPIGGYVKIAGMIDESFDTEYLSKPPEPWEFRSKPIWQRMIVISAGVIMNILLAILIFWAINYIQGSAVRETTTIGYVIEQSAAANAGLQAGDRVLEINGKPVPNWDELLSTFYIETMGNDVTITVQRGNEQKQIFVARNTIPEPNEAPFGIVPDQTQIVVSTVEPGKPADQAGLKPMDVLVSMNGTPIRFTEKVREIVQANAGKPLSIEWKRGNELMTGTTTPTSEGKIGISFGAQYNGPVTRIKYTLLEALPRGLTEIVNVSGLFVQQIWQIITGKTAFSQSVGGPIKIAQMATQSAEMGVLTYLGFMALLSISLAVLNIIPFPALDGGHLLFLVYEGIFRREIPVRVKMGLQRAGFVLLLAFMAFVVYNDILHF